MENSNQAEEFVKHEGLAIHLARQFRLSCPQSDWDDLEQEARIGLAEAIRSYRSERGASLPTYATACIHNRLRRYFRDHVRRERCIQIPDYGNAFPNTD